MIKQLLNTCVDVAWEVLAIEYCLSSAVLTPSNVELVLSVVKGLVVAVERASEYFRGDAILNFCHSF